MLSNKKDIIKKFVAIFIAVVILFYVIVVVIQYNIEGEQNMPFELTKITIVSTAEGDTKENEIDKQNNQWHVNVVQNNDLYFSIKKNENYKGQEKIQNVRIENIVIEQQPQKGIIKKYMPNSLDGRLFSYAEEYLFENMLTYKGAEKSEYKTLQIGNQGGTVLFRISNTNLGEFVLNQDSELIHSGKLLSSVGLNNEEIKFKVKFDLIIDVKNKVYKTTISLDLPEGDILQKGTETREIENDNKFIFKRQ